MNGKNRHLATETRPGSPTDSAYGAGRDGRARSWVNWLLAFLTVPGAAIVMLFALGAIMSTDGEINFGVLFYGAPVVALLVIVVSVVTAKRRFGIAVPLAGLALLVADVAMLAVAVA